MASLLHAPSMFCSCSMKHFHYSYNNTSTKYTWGAFRAKSLSSELVVHSISMEYKSSYKQGGRRKYDCLLFDLDDTLYPVTSGLATACSDNIGEFMVYKLGIDRNVAFELGHLLYKNYGTAVAGLKAIGYEFDNEEFFSFVHGRLPYAKLKPDPVLRSLLLSLPIRKVIFTNADKVHAVKVLSCLGLKDCFEEIICFETLNLINKCTVSDGEDDIQLTTSRVTTGSSKIFDVISHFSQPNASASLLPKTPIVCKPDQYAIEKALKIGNIDPQRTLFFEDSVRNIQSAKIVGLDTALVGTSERIEGADYVLQSIHDIRDALPELWAAVKEL
ncbi:putative pyridoxal phosphatase [Heracleum sosnowskyi]|uniref:Pyridoxal phosphatase n=1 Tax=Heracleum sosnowskyi TaxID=360622 RepID=A0AAD8GUG1_9APIA|nr:putative pyridoxal phosphatase [Heracleum sosnowskyi]